MVADEPVRPSEIARPRDVNDGAVDDAEDALSVEGELRPELSYTDAPPVDSQRAWDRLNEWLPKMLEDLRASKPFNNASKPPSAGRGIYLFSEGAQHLYVGRTGITARSRGAGKEPSTSFFNRWDQHTSRNSPPNSAPFANKLARDLAQAFDLEGPAELKKRFDLMRTADWWRLRKAEEPPDYYPVFQEAKRFIREGLDYRVVEFDDDTRGVRSHVAEVYADAVLQAAYGDFSPS